MLPRLLFPRPGRSQRRSARRTVLLCAEQLEDRRLLSRSILSLDNSWQFIRQDVAGAQSVSFDDSAWTAVSLPHTWNNLDGQDGGNNYYRGIGWYRTHYTVPAALAGQELFIKFDGANLITDLYVNGTFVGEHVGGSAAFVWDLTPYLRVGGDNVLAVKVDNTLYLGAIPLSGDITWDGGLYRHVNLIATDPLHISLTDYASPGVYLQQTNVSAASADLQVTTKLRNDGTNSRQATVVANILDAAGNLVQALTSNVTLGGAAGMDLIQNTTLVNPHLWNGRSDPYLYQVAVQIGDSTTATVVDEVDQPLGLRYFSIDPNNGFFLNGQYLDLHGVGFHQDRLNEGWAISDADQVQDVNLIMDMGATFVRLVYYQRPPKTYDLLDANGIVAWSDLSLNDSAVNSPLFFDNAKQQLRELIRQNYNHPAVLFWGLYDELADSGTSARLVTQLVQVAHAEDPTRPTTAATNLADGKPLNYLTDFIGFNKYYGWYYGSANDFGPWADGVHGAHPNQAIALSEYGAGASIYQHQINAWYPRYPSNFWHPEEYQDLFHEVYWKQLGSRPYLWVKSVWDMFDFAVDNRNEGDAPGRNDKGLVSFDRQTRKDAFYWYKANWSSDPVLYITSRRYINRSSNVVDIKVYSNLSAVQLSVNGVVVGTATSTDHIFRWSSVRLAPGANDVQVTAAAQNGTTIADLVTWYTPLQLGGVPFARIQFQPTSVPVPSGYLPDYGYVFGDRGNGSSYGWDTDNSTNTVVRGVASDARYDALIFMQQPAGGHVWAMAVPNGTYSVHLVSGDPSYFDSIHQIAVGRVLAVSGGVNVLSRYQEAWRTVTVTDGRLTITNATGSSNNKLNFIEINQISVSSVVNVVDFETGDFSQSATHVGGAIVTSPALDGLYSLQLQRTNSVANYEIRQGANYYNLPTAFYSFLFQYASQTGEGGVCNFPDTSSNHKCSLHLSAAGKLLFYDINATLLATGTTTLNANQTYNISAKIGTGSNAAWEIRINGSVEMSGTGNLGTKNNGSFKLGGNNAYTTNYYYDDVAIDSQGYPGGGSTASSLSSSAPLPVSQIQVVNAVIAPVALLSASANGSNLPEALPVMFPYQPLPLRLAGQDTDSTRLSAVNHGLRAQAAAAVEYFFADWDEDDRTTR